MTTRTIDPTGDDLKRIVATVAADTPVTMLNLLRFRDQAAYPATDDAKPCSGRDAYARYSRQALAHVRAVGGEPVVIAEVLGKEKGSIELAHHFADDLGAQSVQSIEMMAGFEEAFDIELDEDAAMAVQTVAGAIDFIADCLGLE